MRTTIVPAQITTVEDKIAGNLNMTQIFLLLLPIFFGSVIYLMFPPVLHFSLYKLPMMLSILLLCCLLAIRIKGRVVVQWIVILMRYNNRPKYFVANKNDEYYRDISYETQTQQGKIEEVVMTKQTEQKKDTTLSFSDHFKLEQYITNPKSNMRFTFAKKGELYVTATEIKQ